MKDEDIAGKEFTIFKYDKFKSISWESGHDKYIGSKGKVRNIHSRYPEYTSVDITTENGRVIQKHFPTHLVIEKLEEEENRSVDDILNEMKQLISRL